MAPDLLRSMALVNMSKYNHPDTIYAFTDGSVDPGTNRAGCGVHIRHMGRVFENCIRIQDGSSTLQTELHAINIALQMAEQISYISHLVIFTDSLGSVYTLRKTQASQNTKLIGSIFFRLDARSGPATSFEWIPSHTGIPGNERADKLAKNALSRSIVDVPLASVCRSQQVARIITLEKTCTVEQNNINIDNSPSFAEYAALTDLKSYKITAKHRRDQVILYYFFTGYKTPQELNLPHHDPICPDCQTDNYNLHHYLYDCTEHNAATNELLTELGLREVDHRAIVQMSMLQPEPILKFFHNHPPPIYLGPRRRDE